jgi:Uma2 family endonuclease
MLPADAEVHRLSFDDVVRMYEAGVLREEDRVELLDGVLVAMNPPGPSHSEVVAPLIRHFVEATAGTELEVRVQDTLRVHGGFLLPDLMVVEPRPKEYLRTARLVVEVSVTSRHYDGAKAFRYARAGVDEYWIVDVVAREVTVHLEPTEIGYDLVMPPHLSGITPRFGGPEVDFAALLGRRA